MIQVLEVRTRRQRKDFIEFPLKLYRNCPQYIPALYMDERKLFKADNDYSDTCETVYYNAYKDGAIAGRISGIIQRTANEKYDQKRVRFTRFDAIEDFEVAKALFAAVEAWALSKGMDTVVGPLGFSDLEREGMLIEGFEYVGTFEETYNYPYYKDFMEKLGYVKEVDWNESRLYAPDAETIAELQAMSDFVARRYKLHFGVAKSTGEFLRKYADGFFELIDKSYDMLYGTVPFTDKMKKMMIENFKLIIDTKYVAVILDENEKMVCFGICFPSLANVFVKSGGRITPGALVRLLKALKRPKVIDCGLVGVDPEYLNRGISVMITSAMCKMLMQDGIEYAETNANLEENWAIQNQWKRFRREIIRRRRAYVKKLS
ncbi:MAG: N-acetyltransferase [Bacteroidales bacterium]|nr:N-acetyltransferase [Bacteroidales bacterium]